MQPLTLSLIQTSLVWEDAAANRSRFDRWFAEVPAASQLVVLPEMFSSGFSMNSEVIAETMQGATLKWMRQRSRELNKILCGSLVVEERGHYFNRFVWVAPVASDNQETMVISYDKRHLFRMAGEQNHYHPGGEHIIVTAGDWRICPMVCYDLRFPVWFRNRGDYDLLLCVANWPQPRQLAWNRLLQARAIENLSYTVGVNRVGEDGNNVQYAGGSAVYDYQGNERLEVFDTEGVFTLTLDGAPLQTFRRRFPAWQDADDFHLQHGSETL